MARWLAALALTLIFAATSTAVAQEAPPEEPEPTVVFKKRTVIDMRGETIEGGTEKPQGKMFNSRRISRFPVKLPVREHFHYEILSSGSGL